MHGWCPRTDLAWDQHFSPIHQPLNVGIPRFANFTNFSGRLRANNFGKLETSCNTYDNYSAVEAHLKFKDDFSTTPESFGRLSATRCWNCGPLPSSSAFSFLGKVSCSLRYCSWSWHISTWTAPSKLLFRRDTQLVVAKSQTPKEQSVSDGVWNQRCSSPLSADDTGSCGHSAWDSSFASRSLLQLVELQSPCLQLVRSLQAVMGNLAPCRGRGLCSSGSSRAITWRGNRNAKVSCFKQRNLECGLNQTTTQTNHCVNKPHPFWLTQTSENFTLERLICTLCPSPG